MPEGKLQTAYLRFLPLQKQSQNLRLIEKKQLFLAFVFQNNFCAPASKPIKCPTKPLKNAITWDEMPSIPLFPAHFSHFSELILVVT